MAESRDRIEIDGLEQSAEITRRHAGEADRRFIMVWFIVLVGQGAGAVIGLGSLLGLQWELVQHDIWLRRRT